MADEDLLQKVHNLGDLGLAALLCLISREHCIISTEPTELDDLVAELQLVASQTFNLSSAVVDCTAQTTLDDLAAAIQLPHSPPPYPHSRSTTPRSTPISPLQPRAEAYSYFPAQARHSLAPLTTTTSGNNNGPPPTAIQQPPQPQPQLQQPLAIANVVLAKNLDRAPAIVQIQCLELLRTRRIFTRTSVQTAPKRFLFVAVLAASARLTPHLNDVFYLAHRHDPEDGFAHLEEEEEEEEEEGEADEDEGEKRDTGNRRGGGWDTGSLSSDTSVLRRTPTTTSVSEWGRPGIGIHRSRHTEAGEPPPTNTTTTNTTNSSPFPTLTESDIATLALLAQKVSVDVDVLRYQLNIATFLRLHRAVSPGSVAPAATRHLGQLARCLAALHALDYATPALVRLAARKVFGHRVRVVDDAGRERSVQWGSDRAAVEALLEGVGPEDVVEDVLGLVTPPL
ncbi:hypothetical protein F4779DRAFT_405482 [Xylariaceae sp. FL0662B]|nr:hypothetical protein F4779DRAFT_405482 [Xylariaceae sp. FL0662B]